MIAWLLGGIRGKLIYIYPCHHNMILNELCATMCKFLAAANAIWPTVHVCSHFLLAV